MKTLVLLVLLAISVVAYSDSRISLTDCSIYVIRVRDGDTFEAFVTVLLGNMIVKEKTAFRLLYINTPERNEKGYEEAKQYLAKRILSRTVSVGIDKFKPRDSFGRFLVEVYTCDGKNINNELIEKKLAKPYKR